jgi:hypothetical protein
MAWAVAAVGGISAIAGISSSRSAKKLQKESLALQKQGLDFSMKRYADFQNQYGGTIQKMVDSARDGVTADLQGVTNRASADVATSMAGQEAARVREQQRMGINPNSGRADSMRRQSGVAGALATAGSVTNAREAERRNAEEQTYSRRLTVGQLGLNQLNGAAAGVTSATQGMASTYGSMANQESANATQFLSGAGSMLGSYMAGRPAAAAAPTGVTAGSLNVSMPPLGMNVPAMPSKPTYSFG